MHLKLHSMKLKTVQPAVGLLDQESQGDDPFPMYLK